MDKDIRRLPDSELELMQIIWDLTPPVARQDIEAHLPQGRPLAQVFRFPGGIS